MSSLLDIDCTDYGELSFKEIFYYTDGFCCLGAHTYYTTKPITDKLWGEMCSETTRYKRDENNYIVCPKPCRFCIMNFVLKRLMRKLRKHYLKVKKYKYHLMNIKNLRDREIKGRVIIKS